MLIQEAVDKLLKFHESTKPSAVITKDMIFSN